MANFTYNTKNVSNVNHQVVELPWIRAPYAQLISQAIVYYSFLILFCVSQS